MGYGVSITDCCVSIQETEEMLDFIFVYYMESYNNLSLFELIQFAKMSNDPNYSQTKITQCKNLLTLFLEYFIEIIPKDKINKKVLTFSENVIEMSNISKLNTNKSIKRNNKITVLPNGGSLKK